MWVWLLVVAYLNGSGIPQVDVYTRFYWEHEDACQAIKKKMNKETHGQWSCIPFNINRQQLR